jgi:hypothetical protein
MAKFITMFMALNKEIENYFAVNRHRHDGRLLMARDQKKELLTTARRAARETLIWALDERQDQIEINKYFYYPSQYLYYSKDRVTGRVYNDLCYQSVAHEIRSELRVVLRMIMIDPINLFLYNNEMPNVDEPAEERKYSRAVNREYCSTPCQQRGDNYWWCGTNDGDK